MSIPRFYYLLRETQWRLFFKPNGVRTWTDIRFTGFRESQSQLRLHGQWVGTTNTGELYYTAATIDCCGEWRFTSEETRGNWSRAKMNTAKASIETFLDPKCRCRVGFHWKCGIHRKWVN